MADRLRDSYGLDVAEWVAVGLARVWPQTDVAAFLRACAPGYDGLDLMARGSRIAQTMIATLPPDPAHAVPLVTRALGPIEPNLTGMTSFRYLPHGMVVSEIGLQVFAESMTALYELTRRFTAEFAVRPFLVALPDATLAQLGRWVHDPDPRVRRLVSEGTRPRLPWAARLPAFVADPRPVVGLLEQLRDDPSPDVRRSVANNLNDISKDHPQLVVDLAQEWWADDDPARQALIRHALRTLVKRADPAALAVLGVTGGDSLVPASVSITPGSPRIGQNVRIEVVLTDPRTSGPETSVAVDYVIDFVKASGRTAPRVFKAGVYRVGPGGTIRVGRTVSLAQHSTRTHYPGRHPVHAQVNGRRVVLGEFDLREA